MEKRPNKSHPKYSRKQRVHFMKTSVFMRVWDKTCGTKERKMSKMTSKRVPKWSQNHEKLDLQSHLAHPWVPEGFRHRFLVDLGVPAGPPNRYFLRKVFKKQIPKHYVFLDRFLETFLEDFWCPEGVK